MDFSKYFTKKTSLQLGVDIGFGFLKIALLQISPGKTILFSYRCEDLSQFKTDIDKDDFILRQVEDCIKAYGLSKRIIRLNLPITNAVFVKTIKLPSMPEREIASAAKWQIKDEVSANTEETEFAWLYTLPRNLASKSQISIICVVVKKNFLNKYVELFKRSDISLSEITFSPFSINAIISTENEGMPVLDIGDKQSIFSMHHKGRLLFTRVIHVGSCNFKAVNQDGAPSCIEHLSDELVRSTKYCEFGFIKQALNCAYLTGGGARAEELVLKLKEASGLDVKILRFPRDIQVDEGIRKDFEAKRDSLQILPAVGAAIDSASKIDVLPLEARIAKFLLFQKISFRLIGLTAALILLLSYFAMQLNINIIKKRLNNAKVELVFLKEAETLKFAINEYVQLTNWIRQNRIPPQWALKYISNTMPDNMVLSSFILSNKDGIVNLKGIVYTKGTSAEGAITEFTRNLKQIELFGEVKLLSLEKGSNADTYNFNIVCNLAK